MQRRTAGLPNSWKTTDERQIQRLTAPAGATRELSRTPSRSRPRGGRCRRCAPMLGSRVTVDLNASLTTSNSYSPMRPRNPVMRHSTQPTGLKGL